MYGLVLENLSTASVYFYLLLIYYGYLYIQYHYHHLHHFSLHKRMFSLLLSFAIIAVSFYSSYCMHFKVGV